MIESKVYKGAQVTIPSIFRKKYNVKKDDIVEWEDTKEGIKISFRKKRKFTDIKGIAKINEKTNAVELKKDLYK